MTYSTYDIDKIEETITDTCEADNWVTPTFHLVTTLVAYFASFYIATKHTNFLTYLLFSLIIVRLFMIFHDLCHKSFYPTNERKDKKWGFNMTVACLIETLCIYPAQLWSVIHSRHHKIHGNLNHFDSSRTVYTSSEYNKLPRVLKIFYEILRFPPIFFLLIPIKTFWLERLLFDAPTYLFKYVTMLYVIFKFMGKHGLITFLVSSYIATILGTMLFHLQHQINEGYWKRFDNEDYYSKKLADLTGASVLKIPWFLEYFTNGIEYHDVHHFNPGVPSYNIKSCYNRLLKKGIIKNRKISYTKSLKSLFHYIYNEETERYESQYICKLLGLES